MRVLALVVLAALSFASIGHAKVFEILDWTDPVPVELPRSKGLLKAPATWKQLVGADVPILWDLLNSTMPPVRSEEHTSELQSH